MILFFRRIRKKLADDNRPIKYLRYAIGEIVLVVIGVLIALQINNSNINNNVLVESYVIQINEEIEYNIKELNIVKNRVEKSMTELDTLIQLLKTKDYDNSQFHLKASHLFDCYRCYPRIIT